MALIVTFSTLFYQDSVQPPVQKGSAARTELIVTNGASGASTSGSLAALETENVVDIYAQEDAWYQIGSNPTADAEGATNRFIASGERVQHGIETGQKVAAIGT